MWVYGYVIGTLCGCEIAEKLRPLRRGWGFTTIIPGR